MRRPDFYAGIHPQFDCDVAAQRRNDYMTKLEGQRDELAAEVRQLLLSIDCYAKHAGFAKGVQGLKTTQASRDVLARLGEA